MISDIRAVREMYPALTLNTELFQWHLEPFTAVSLRKTGMDDTTKLLLTGYSATIKKDLFRLKSDRKRSVKMCISLRQQSNQLWSRAEKTVVLVILVILCLIFQIRMKQDRTRPVVEGWMSSGSPGRRGSVVPGETGRTGTVGSARAPLMSRQGRAGSCCCCTGGPSHFHCPLTSSWAGRRSEMA